MPPPKPRCWFASRHGSNVLLAEIAETSRAVATTSARLAKRELIAECLLLAISEGNAWS